MVTSEKTTCGMSNPVSATAVTVTVAPDAVQTSLHRTDTLKSWVLRALKSAAAARAAVNRAPDAPADHARAITAAATSHS